MAPARARLALLAKTARSRRAPQGFAADDDVDEDSDDDVDEDSDEDVDEDTDESTACWDPVAERALRQAADASVD